MSSEHLMQKLETLAWAGRTRLRSMGSSSGVSLDDLAPCLGVCLSKPARGVGTCCQTWW